MTLVSNSFILFVVLCMTFYYTVPKKCQWLVLLVFSYVYYAVNSPKAIVFIVTSTVITYLTAGRIERVKSWEEEKNRKQKKAKKILLIGMLSNISILAVLKYTDFVIENWNTFTGERVGAFNFILPLGISYYTFQTVGYILDVYWGKTSAEKNFFRLALFVSFFPQLLQGPIGRYERLAPQLWGIHPFSGKNIKYGLERILWGMFKKMILADWAAVFTAAIFQNPEAYPGIAAFGVLLYSVELYGNFSGGIDIVTGIANMLGITMDENFARPFFATSIADFWRRWHITLGSWMKDYVFYPLSLSGVMRKCGKKAKGLFGKRVGRTIPICIANLVVFFIVGIWHGPTWSNIGWGLYNGVIIAFSGLFAHQYEILKAKLHINDKTKIYRGFMVIRTFFLINISWYFDCVSSFDVALKMMTYSVTRFQPSQILSIPAGKLGTDFTPYALCILAIGCFLLLLMGIYQERGGHVRDKLNTLPWVAELTLCLVLFACIPLFAPQSIARGFIYAQF